MSSPIPPDRGSAADAIAGFDTSSNDGRIAELVALIGSGEAVALVGAGLSRSLGYDSWPDLLEHLAARADAIRTGFVFDPRPTTPREYLSYAQRIRDHIADARDLTGFYDEVGRRFYRSEETIRAALTPLHSDLVRLPFRAFLTTNYDDVIEIAMDVAYPERGKPEAVAIWNGNDHRLLSPAVRGIAVPESIRYVLHLHGVYWTPSSVILCADDYAQAYGIPELAPRQGPPTAAVPRAHSRPTPLILLTAALLATRRVVFFGFSLDDAYFSEVLRRVSDMLWEWGGVTHFAIMPIEQERSSEQLIRANELRRDLGIETVFYPVVDGAHGALPDLVARIAREVTATPRPQTVTASLPGTPAESPPVPEWAQRNNAQQLERIERRAH